MDSMIMICQKLGSIVQIIFSHQWWTSGEKWIDVNCGSSAGVICQEKGIEIAKGKCLKTYKINETRLVFPNFKIST